MHLFRLEQSRAAYIADFVAYGVAVIALAALLSAGPSGQRMLLVSLALGGFAGWTLVEYLLHRFVLHGLQPFRAWHTAHHQRPKALIGTPTLLSAVLITVLVFAPAFAWGGVWRASALTVGFLIGYLAYALTHHATHHWRSSNDWFSDRKRWHAQHHRRDGHGTHYGVTVDLWDHVFGSSRPPVAARATKWMVEGGHLMQSHVRTAERDRPGPSSRGLHRVDSDSSAAEHV